MQRTGEPYIYLIKKSTCFCTRSPPGAGFDSHAEFAESAEPLFPASRHPAIHRPSTRNVFLEFPVPPHARHRFTRRRRENGVAECCLNPCSVVPRHARRFLTQRAHTERQERPISSLRVLLGSWAGRQRLFCFGVSLSCAMLRASALKTAAPSGAGLRMATQNQPQMPARRMARA